MTTLAAAKPRTLELGNSNDLPMIANDAIYEGAAVGLSGGLARPLVAADPFAGFADRTADNTGGAASAVRARVLQRGRIVLPVAGVDGPDDVGKAVYASDDDTFTLTEVGNTLIGRMARHIGGTTALVEFDINLQAAV